MVLLSCFVLFFYVYRYSDLTMSVESLVLLNPKDTFSSLRHKLRSKAVTS